MSKKTMGKQTAHKNNRTTKKKAVLGTEKKSPAIKILALSGFALVIGAFLVFNHFKDREGNAIASTPSAVVTKDAVTYPVSLFADGKARHFSHKIDGLTIRYFVLKSADGVIRAAFDACDVCWPANKGLPDR